MNEIVRRSPDLKINNNDVEFVLMDEHGDQHQENGDDEVGDLTRFGRNVVFSMVLFVVIKLYFYIALILNVNIII